jgi:uncharacterized LabA/DUF88 family protein
VNKDYLKDLVAKTISEVQGCKATELVPEIIRRLEDVDRKALFDGDYDLPDLVEEMITEGMLVEVEYILPTEKTNSFLLPAGTVTIQGI